MGRVNEGAPRREGLSVLLVGGEAERVGQALEVLRSVEDLALDVAQAQTGAAEQMAAHADVVLVFFGGDEERALAYIGKQSEANRRPALFAMLSEQSPTLIRRALRAGADEVLFLPLSRVDVFRPLLKVSEAKRRAGRRLGGKIFSVTSLGGGVGVTMLCGNLGLALLGEGSARLAMVDLDLQQASLSNMLGASPERGILGLMRTDGKPDSISLEAALTRHACGLYVLGAPPRIEDSEKVTDHALGKVLELMRQLFDYVVIDCGGHVDANSVAAWEHSQEVLYVLDQSITAVNRAGRFLDLFERLGIEGVEPRIVVNRYQAGHAIGEGQIAATLHRSIYARIPRDERLMEKAAALARMPAQIAPSCALVRACEDLALRLSANPDAAGTDGPRAGGGFVTRLFGALGSRA